MNHSSVLYYLNGGHVTSNTHRKIPLLLCKDLTKQPSQYVKLTNERLFERSQTMGVEMSKLELEPPTPEVIHLQNAANILSKDYYLRCKTFQLHTSEYDKTYFPIPGTYEVEVRI
jgi:hypothetical protein